MSDSQTHLPQFFDFIDIEDMNTEPGRIKLHPQTVEAIARRVIELLQARAAAPSSELVDAAELARRLGVDRSWVYSHAIELGAMKLGKGPRARLRFDPAASIGGKASHRFAKSPRQVGPKRRREKRAEGDEKHLLPIRGDHPGVKRRRRGLQAGS